MKKNRFGSIGAFQMAQMNKVYEVMRQDTLKKLRNMNVNYGISSENIIMINEERLQEYIEKVISDACSSEKRPNDVKYQYRLIGNNLLFAIRSNYRKVRVRAEYRLLKNLPKNFGLSFHLVSPDPAHENDACRYAAKFDLFPLSQGVDPNHSVDNWEVFGRQYTIRAYPSVYPLERGLSHLQRLKACGFDYETDWDWETFLRAFIAAYDRGPLQMVSAGE